MTDVILAFPANTRVVATAQAAVKRAIERLEHVMDTSDPNNPYDALACRLAREQVDRAEERYRRMLVGERDGE